MPSNLEGHKLRVATLRLPSVGKSCGMSGFKGLVGNSMIKDPERDHCLLGRLKDAID